MKAVLHEVGRIGSHTLWDPLETLMKHMEGDSNLSTEANGAAAAFDHDARWEAASKLIRNRENVLNDVSNPSPMTQHELQRVTLHEKHYADEALREVARRMLGLREADEPIAHALGSGASRQKGGERR